MVYGHLQALVGGEISLQNLWLICNYDSPKHPTKMGFAMASTDSNHSRKVVGDSEGPKSQLGGSWTPG